MGSPGTTASGARILFLREPEEDDPYERLFSSAGYEIVSAPVLTFKNVNSSLLNEALDTPEAFSGLILTSPRAAERVVGAAAARGWRDLPVYCVGPRTQSILSGRFPRIAGSGAASGSELAAHIAAVHRGARPLLFPCGNRRREELPEILRAHSVPIQELVVYETEFSLPDLRSALSPRWVAFFSPSGVRAAGVFVRETWPDAWAAAIGPTTDAALSEEGLSARAVAEKPDPDGLLRAILRADIERGAR